MLKANTLGPVYSVSKSSSTSTSCGGPPQGIISNRTPVRIIPDALLLDGRTVKKLNRKRLIMGLWV
jgi:hypothetical protein